MRRSPRGAGDVPPLRAPAGLLRDAGLRPAPAHVPRPLRAARLRRRRRVRLDWQDDGKQYRLAHDQTALAHAYTTLAHASPS